MVDMNMELSNFEKRQMRKGPKKVNPCNLLHSPDFYIWLPVALEHMAKETFENRIRRGFGTIEECATKPIDPKKQNKRKSGELTMIELCQEYNVPRVSFYSWRKRRPDRDEIKLLPNREQVAMYAAIREMEHERL